MRADEYKKIITLAIDREVEAYTFYKSVADRVKDANLKKLFAELAGEEKKHREFLQDFLAKGEKAMKFEAAMDYKVYATLETPQITADLKPLEGLTLAIKKELEAMQMYTRLAAASADAQQQMLFRGLANMESTHKARLEDIYVNMAFPEKW
ncbi:MAG: putative trifunctional 2-polyprenylphenol hydroxylase/glutamate synthase subunit beta/ferritin domain-containing protein [Methanoregula sp. PtaU1.Bin051]|nr:MAG: putative trifunctional 2-polyprenylphenol hydroxylase/glutamate synthase subunit beta/ferritin domain-containing protein [Methanoregula sp. PtaU1.Bin051]